MEVTRLVASEWERFRAIRLRSLVDAPGAFESTYDQAVSRPPSDWPTVLDRLPTFVVDEDGIDIGVVRCAPDHALDDTAWLISMWVAPEARGRGVGDVLVTTVVDFATSAGYKRLCLSVSDDNSFAIQLYERHGFEPTGEVGRMAPPRQHISEHRRSKALALEAPA